MRVRIMENTAQSQSQPQWYISLFFSGPRRWLAAAVFNTSAMQEIITNATGITFNNLVDWKSCFTFVQLLLSQSGLLLAPVILRVLQREIYPRCSLRWMTMQHSLSMPFDLIGCSSGAPLVATIPIHVAVPSTK